MNDILNPDLTTGDRCNATRAWDMIEERIRILRGKVKAGSRNISVREPHPSELKAKLLKPVLSGLIQEQGDQSSGLRGAEGGCDSEAGGNK